ncbi:hypothetical protein LTR17_024616 [Elasticomyces elasticus]|nr:hypothetical protein LTR17_024616 [Elasticomyces elasticus]
MYNQTTPTQHYRTPSAWPSELGTASYMPHEVTSGAEQPWMPPTSIWPTIAPATTIWQPSFAVPQMYDPSPSLSSYSASPHPSAVSSPYAHSEGYARHTGSPLIKLEDSLEPSSMQFSSDFYRVNTTPGSRVVTTSGHSPAIYSQQIVDPVLPSSSNDSKSPALERRPASRKAYSCDDFRATAHQERHKRGYTKQEEAVCSCEQCGKVFQRQYNLKAHMETHNPGRPQNHVCPYAECEKRFVRRTDLLRHESSVHLKTRNWTCHLCDVSFARKDTLRRHVDDGCPRRPEVKRRMSKARRRSSGQS